MFDLVAAVASPLIAFWVRLPDFIYLYRDDYSGLYVYCGSAAATSVISFLSFRVAQGLPRYFSFHDAVEIAKAAFTSVAVASAVMFSFTRLEDVPRSVPIIHFFVLAFLLISGRVVRRSLDRLRDPGGDEMAEEAEEAVMLVGVGRLAGFYLQILDTFAFGHRRVVGILDATPGLVGRSMFGHLVMGRPEDARLLVDDFASHGVVVSRFVICERRRAEAQALRAMLLTLCADRNVAVDILAEDLGVLEEEAGHPLAIRAPVRPAMPREPRYLRARRYVDATLAGAALVVLAPAFVVLAPLVLATMGAPAFFWQRRTGRGGRPIYVYKFRSMRNPVDSTGRRLSDAERASGFGAFLRATRLDELPQLFNVMRGDMAIIGPRPLLPVDQPADPGLRLSVRPGITGWAQIHGGKLVTPEEKNRLDEHYVRHASLSLDARIVLMTIRTVLLGDRRDAALEKALAPERRRAA